MRKDKRQWPWRQKREFQCVYCGKIFHPHRAKQKCCSRYCAGKAKQVARVKSVCLFCEKEFYERVSRRAKYCSKQCHSKDKKRLLQNSGNPNWKGGISFVKRQGIKAGKSGYTKGKRGENKVRVYLAKEGYYTIRSGASKGIWDIVGISKNSIRLIQVKVNHKAGPSERAQMRNFKCPTNCKKECWSWYDQRKEPIIECFNVTITGRQPANSVLGDEIGTGQK